MKFAALLLMSLLSASAAYADPVWQKVFLDEGVYIDMPGKPTISKGQYRDFVARAVTTKIYTTEFENIRYRVTVADFRNRLIDTPNILGEAYIGWLAKGTKTDDFPLRTNTVGRAAFGRHLAVDMKDGVNAAASIFMYHGYLFFFETDLLPGSDRGSPDPARFHYSIDFDIKRDWTKVPGAQLPDVPAVAYEPKK